MDSKTLKYLAIGITGLILCVGLLLGSGYLSAMVMDGLDERIFWIAFIIMVLLSLIYTFKIDDKDQKELTIKTYQYLDIGKHIFIGSGLEFEAFYNEYCSTKIKILRPINALADFADKKELSMVIDWRGEENEGEIEDFIALRVKREITWSNTLELRQGNSGGDSRDGKFIIRLFKSIEKDLLNIDHQLLFFDLGSDSYVFMITDSVTFKKIMTISSSELHGAAKLRT